MKEISWQAMFTRYAEAGPTWTEAPYLIAGLRMKIAQVGKDRTPIEGFWRTGSGDQMTIGVDWGGVIMSIVVTHISKMWLYNHYPYFELLQSHRITWDNRPILIDDARWRHTWKYADTFTNNAIESINANLTRLTGNRSKPMTYGGAK